MTCLTACSRGLEKLTALSASQKESFILLNSKGCHNVQNSPPNIPIPSYMNQFHNLQRYFSKIHCNIVLYLRRLGHPSFSDFSTNILYAFITTRSAHFILLDFIILTLGYLMKSKIMELPTMQFF